MRSRAFERYPDIYKDDRGCFLEVLKHNVGLIYTDQWYSDLSWVKQINRSISKPGVIRGMHA
jgi:dTDP-4-dehydrorhamnose 3,5-epimerase-like enzyme